ncbi:MAG TPA: hypothetical protein VGL00_15420 [Terracidiphilus sp.]
MRSAWASLVACGMLAAPLAWAQSESLTLPKAIEAGSALSIPSSGSGKATLYIVGLGQVLKHEVELGQTTYFPPGTLYSAGHYITVLARESGAAESGSFDVTPASKAADVTFLARPSRLPVGLHGGITGAAYVFDAYRNLITAPTQVSFELSSPKGGTQTRQVETRHGAAWTEMDSTAQQGTDKFVARVGDVSSARIIGQVPGDPCSLKMSARPAGSQIQLQTEPVRDCSGNAVPDGTIVTFTENYDGGESTVDVPLKRGIAEVKMPARPGARISVASGVVLGNEIRWER